MVKAHRLLSIDRADFPRLAALAPTFAITAATTVILASMSKALFLSTQPISMLPWMFLGSAALTALSSLGYVALISRVTLRTRYPALLAFVSASLAAIRLLLPSFPDAMAMVVLLWCPVVGQLIMVQAWNTASSLLPTRQGKRLFPVLASVTTLGAVAGGVLVQMLLAWIATEELLWLAVILLAWPLLTVRGLVKDLEGTRSDRKGAPKTSVRDTRSGELAIRNNPLLVSVALVVFFMQAASLLLDYQFSAELQPQFDKDDMASFLGMFYWGSNLVVLLLTLVATSRAIRALGVGVLTALSAVAVGLGGAVYLAAGSAGLSGTFWIIAATAFAERVAQYAFAKPAAQMLMMPLDNALAERAKTIIDGVVYRFATIVVSAGLLLLGDGASSNILLSIPLIVLSAIAVVAALRIGPRYRQAVFEGLSARRLDRDAAEFLRANLGEGALSEVELHLNSGDERKVRKALAVAAEMKLDVEPSLLRQLARSDNDAITAAALRAMEALGTAPDIDLWRHLLSPAQPMRVLRTALQMLVVRDEPALEELVRPLMAHPERSVASLACAFRMLAAGRTALAALDREVAGSETIRHAPERLTGATQASDYARELPQLLKDPLLLVRREAAEQMGHLRLPSFLDPLIEALAQPELRSSAIASLGRYGHELVQRASAELNDEHTTDIVRAALIDALELQSSRQARDCILQQCDAHVPMVRRHAVEALWRSVAHGDQLERRDAVERLVLRELDRLERYAAIESRLLGAAGPRRIFFVTELEHARLETEARVFRLLGLLYDRATVARAALHYRSEDRKTRSNAIELLDQTLANGPLDKLIHLIERTEDEQGKMRPRTLAHRGVDRDLDVSELLEESWLRRVWRWSSDDVQDEPLGTVMRLQRCSLFSEAAGPTLLRLARAAALVPFRQGHSVRCEGVGVVMAGKLELRRGDRAIRTLDVDDAVGVIELVDGGAPPGELHAVVDGRLLAIPPATLHDARMIDANITAGMIRQLSGLLRRWAVR